LRESVFTNVIGIIQEPRYIYLDSNYEKNKRIKYIDYVILGDTIQKIKSLIVIVDTDRDPYEVVTWSVRNETKKETGGIIYDSRENKTKSN
jgi:hypothetical protein